MLKITAIDRAGHRTLMVEGKLVDPWLPELQRAWIEASHTHHQRSVVIDLRDVTAISERGKELIQEMMEHGAKFNCSHGVLTRHVLKRLLQACIKRKKTRGGEENREVTRGCL